ncbi:LegC family aminotransferase [Paenibacillus albus]|uniref:LegC family aminotransferase n=1 Tax=Paenibacillus albus TaxID=2495582 RepID=A0A3S8ZYJ2_9BACL|nr:LegC family aminotransferase [Paenibacillus albus]AZN38516.1 LegC family aminotransferase [Paenibacillus albus]
MERNNGSLASAVTEAIACVTGMTDKMLALHEPEFKGNEWDYVKECLDTGWVSSAGKYVDRLEAELSEYTGAKHAIAVVNGTAALHIALLLAGVKPGDEVIIPSLSFVATANAVAYCQAIPHFVDVDTYSLGIDPRRLGDYLSEMSVRKTEGLFNRHTGRRIGAVVPMHTFGHPVDLDRLIDVCAAYGLPIVEDAAESLGSYYKGRHTGTFGKLGILSFNGNKVMTTGGGGAILTDDADLAKAAKHMTTTAKVAHAWAFNHDMVGYNYRMPNLNAALGCAQLERVPNFLERKRKLAGQYADQFRLVSGVSFVKEPSYAVSNYWLNAILLDQANVSLRDGILAQTNAARYLTRPIWTPLHTLPMYSQCPRMDLSVTMDIEGRVVNIPSGPSIVQEAL